MGNELADLRAKKEVWMGSRRGDSGVVTAGGIRHEFRVTWRAKQVQQWDREALKGHTYIHTDRGPFRHWLHKIGRAETAECPCGETAQNAAHVMKCRLIGGGEKSADNEEFCRAVFRFLWGRTEEEWEA